jgi:hypothetical protein
LTAEAAFFAGALAVLAVLDGLDPEEAFTAFAALALLTGDLAGVLAGGLFLLAVFFIEGSFPLRSGPK